MMLPDPAPSPALQDPVLELAAKILVTAVRDLHSRDAIRAVDSLAWLIDGPAPLFLESLDMPSDRDLFFHSILERA